MHKEEPVGIVVPRCPHIRPRYSPYRGQEVRSRTPVALNLVPLCAIPVQHQRHGAADRERFVIADRPHIVGRYSVHVVQVDRIISYVGGWHLAPETPVPVYGNHVELVASHSPHIVARHRRHRAELVEEPTWSYAPGVPVPVYRQRLRLAGGGELLH